MTTPEAAAHVLRGGCFGDLAPRWCCVGSRHGRGSDACRDYRGFRPVAKVKKGKP